MAPSAQIFALQAMNGVKFNNELDIRDLNSVQANHRRQFNLAGTHTSPLNMTRNLTSEPQCTESTIQKESVGNLGMSGLSSPQKAHINASMANRHGKDPLKTLDNRNR